MSGASSTDLRASAAAKRRLHLSACPHSQFIRIASDVRPCEGIAFPYLARDTHIMREPERQESIRERALGGALPAPDTEAALAVEYLARLKPPLGDGDHIGVPGIRRAGRLPTQHRGRDRHAEFEPDHVDRPVERGIAAAPVWQHVIFAKARARVIGAAL